MPTSELRLAAFFHARIVVCTRRYDECMTDEGTLGAREWKISKRHPLGCIGLSLASPISAPMHNTVNYHNIDTHGTFFRSSLECFCLCLPYLDSLPHTCSDNTRSLYLLPYYVLLKVAMSHMLLLIRHRRHAE